MATGVKFEQLSTDIAEGVHDNLLSADTDTMKIYLSNAAPSASADAVKADLAEITNENGYTAPVDVLNLFSVVAGQIRVAGTDVVITASGGTVGPFQHAIAFNDTPSSPLDPLICYWTRAAGAITLQDGESFTVDFGATIFTVG